LSKSAKKSAPVPSSSYTKEKIQLSLDRKETKFQAVMKAEVSGNEPEAWFVMGVVHETDASNKGAIGAALPFILCSKCRKVLSYSGGSTSSLNKHPCVKNRKTPDRPLKQTTVLAYKRTDPSAEDNQKVTKAAIVACAVDMRPFAFVAGTGEDNIVYLVPN
jgi:hypothetical protein